MKFQIKDILRATGGKLLVEKEITGNFSISTDTRTISAENIFLPLSGANFDGHDFINSALKKGCRGFFIDKDRMKAFSALPDGAEFIIAVDNTLEAYLKLANFARHKINPVVIAVTGSSGKTSVKEMLYSVLSTQYKTCKSELNYNNEIGLCQTILNMPENTEYLVVEMGMRGLGEIELLSKYAEPDIAVITNIGTAHIGRLSNIENIAKAKCEITKYLSKQGTLIACNDQLIKDYQDWAGNSIYYSLENVKILHSDSEGSKFVYKNNTYELSVSGEFNVTNALAAIETGLLSGMIPSKINEGLLQYQPVGNRWKIVGIENNIKIVNDSYNANPESVKASVNALISSYKNSKICVVLGDMGELGEHEGRLHREVGVFLDDKSINELITVGEKAKWIADSVKNPKIKVKSFNQNDEAVQYLIDNLASNYVILLKASRSMSFENIFERLTSKTGV